MAKRKLKSCNTGYLFIAMGTIVAVMRVAYTPTDPNLSNLMVGFSVATLALGTYGIVKKPKLVCGKWFEEF